MSQSQNNHRRNNKNHRNGKKQNGQRNQRISKKELKDKKVPMRYQVQNTKETNSVEFKCTVDGTVEKTKLSVYEDGSDESFLKMVKEFLNYVGTYELWEDENAARTVYRNFRRCLAGAARDLWDQINVLEDKEEIRDELTFDNHLKELTSAILGDDALRNQKDYLKTTPKPEKLSVKQWVNQNKNINSYLPLMQPNGRSFSEEDLIKEVISKNIPTVWVKGFKMFKLHLKISIKDILSELTVIEEQIKTRPKGNQDNPNKKHLKNPCRIHGTYEWDECRQNPKNNKNNDKDKTNNDRHKTDATNRSREHRRTEEDNRNFARTTRNHNDNADETSYDEYEYNCITKQASKTNTPSSEILIALPHQAGSKKILLTLDF
jgi:hypothetical protein